MDYGNIARALEFYRGRGYIYVEDAPWMVDKPAYYATKPPQAQADVIKEREDGTAQKFLVASGEQSFIQMMLDGQPLKRAICVTPCYRVEKYDALRRPAFMKAELINAHDVDDGHLIHMVHEAASFFEQFFSVRIVRTGVSGGSPTYDIIEKGTRIELGSYGIRRISVGDTKLDWVYGTACAEPRLSTVIARHSKETGK